MDMEPVIRLENISREFFDGKIRRKVLKNINLEIYPGELTVVAGPSGSGKTTLLTIMGLVLRPTDGKIIIGDREVTGSSEAKLATLRLQNYGFVFQQDALIPALSAEDNILFAHSVQGDRATKELKRKALDLLAQFGLDKQAHVKPQRLSGGEKQRVSIARAMINDPVLLLCDEPTSSLDVENSKIVLDVLKKLSRDESRGVVLISHDSRVFSYADRLVKLENGEIVYDNREEKKKEAQL
jgi:putative ABC transport system ATP-binding protein